MHPRHRNSFFSLDCGEWIEANLSKNVSVLEHIVWTLILDVAVGKLFNDGEV